MPNIIMKFYFYSSSTIGANIPPTLPTTLVIPKVVALKDVGKDYVVSRYTTAKSAVMHNLPISTIATIV